MKHILLPTDFSENSWNAITYAIQLFKDEECTFHLLNTYTPIIYNLEYAIGAPAQFGLGDALRSNSQRNLKELKNRISNSFTVNPIHSFETRSRFDTLIGAIKEYAEKYPKLIIVMGSKGATGAKEVLFGSNTVHVFKEIKCPIVAIPSNFDYENPHDILFPTDLELDYMNNQLALLKGIAQMHTARINAMYVSDGNTLTQKQEANKEILTQECKELAFVFHQFKHMEVAEAITQFQVKTKVNLLVMINNKHSFFENLFFKSTINQIGFQLQIPFLVIPSNQ